MALFPPFYPILGLADLNAHPQLPEMLAESGVLLIQLREKTAPSREILEASKNLVSRLSSTGARIIVNDRADIAAISGAGGVHVGQEDLSVEAARKICGPERWVGVSTHNREQFQLALATSAVYIAVGPIFPTATKANPNPVVGIDFLKAARRLTRKPLVAIGGITVQSAEPVYGAGADSIAAISDLLSVPNPAERAREYIAIAELVRSKQA